MIDPIQAGAKRRGITRLCHFTPSRNLAHIAGDLRGILAAKYLQEDEKAIFNPTDLKRLGRLPGSRVLLDPVSERLVLQNRSGKGTGCFQIGVVLFIEAHYLCARRHEVLSPQRSGPNTGG